MLPASQTITSRTGEADLLEMANISCLVTDVPPAYHHMWCTPLHSCVGRMLPHGQSQPIPATNSATDSATGSVAAGYGCRISSCCLLCDCSQVNAIVIIKQGFQEHKVCTIHGKTATIACLHTLLAAPSTMATYCWLTIACTRHVQVCTAVLMTCAMLNHCASAWLPCMHHM